MNEIGFLKQLEQRSELNRYNKRKLQKAEKQEAKMQEKINKRTIKKEEEEDVMGVQMIERMCNDYNNANIHEIGWEDDDIKRLCADNYLTPRKSNELKKKNIFKISQMQQMKMSMGDDLISRIASADTIGDEWAKAIYNVIDLYEFPKNNNIASVEEPKETAKTPVNVPEPKVVEPKEQKEEYEKKDGKIDIEKFADDLVEENDLADSLLNTVLDLASEEKSVGLIEFNPSNGKTERTGGSNIILNEKVLLVEHIFLKRAFDQKIKETKVRLIGEHERDTEKYFEIALKNLENYIKLSWKEGKKFYYTRKDYTGNRLNYIQFDINLVENRLNRLLKFNNCKKAALRLLPPSNITPNLVGTNGAYTVINNHTVKKPAKVEAVIKDNIKIPKGVSGEFKKNPKAKIDYNESDIVTNPTTGKNENKNIKEEIKMSTNNTNSSIKVLPKKCQEFIPGSGTFVAAFEVVKESAPVKNKFEFDFTVAQNAKTSVSSKGYIFYIFEKDNPKKGRYSIPSDLQEHFEVIKFGVNEFFNS